MYEYIFAAIARDDKTIPLLVIPPRELTLIMHIRAFWANNYPGKPFLQLFGSAFFNLNIPRKRGLWSLSIVEGIIGPRFTFFRTVLFRSRVFPSVLSGSSQMNNRPSPSVIGKGAVLGYTPHKNSAGDSRGLPGRKYYLFARVAATKWASGRGAALGAAPGTHWRRRWWGPGPA